MLFTYPARLAILSIFSISLILPANVQAQSSRNARYGERDAKYVINTRDRDVLDYVICLEDAFSPQPRRLSVQDALDNASDDCRREANRLPQRQARSTIRQINRTILDCGFRKEDAQRIKEMTDYLAQAGRDELL